MSVRNTEEMHSHQPPALYARLHGASPRSRLVFGDVTNWHSHIPRIAQNGRVPCATVSRTSVRVWDGPKNREMMLSPTVSRRQHQDRLELEQRKEVWEELQTLGTSHLLSSCFSVLPEWVHLFVLVFFRGGW